MRHHALEPSLLIGLSHQCSMLSTSVVASIMNRIGQSTLELLWNSLLNTLGDDRGITPVLRVGLTTSVGSSIVDLDISTCIANN